ncbi:YcaO-like family protein [Streptomyces sp. NPDC001594]|uniref:YcaO-like family protein n=1 Tax=Streptomyces sp. NPDC001594 TaxID=3364590 RepID=UPI0036789FD4
MTCTTPIPTRARTGSVAPALSVERLGTHRALAAEETWRRLEPLFPRAGITRVADVTKLDDIGFPVWQAVRPNSANLSVSQGKGLTHRLARVSAAMESYESWAAEQPRPDAVVAGLAELADALTYDPLRLAPSADRTPQWATPLLWCPAEDLTEGCRTWLPVDAVTVDLRVRPYWAPDTFATVTSNGLAGGNTLTEATLHALLEVVERDDLVRASATPGGLWAGAVAVRPGRFGAAAAVLRHCAAAGAVVEVADCTGPWGVPTFTARLWSPSLPSWFSGSGTHHDADVALSRAVTEAVQSRLTAVAGARDDLPFLTYASEGAQPPTPGCPDSDELITRHHPAPSPEPPGRDLDADLADLLGRLAADGHHVLRADLTPEGAPIPVVRVVVPGSRCDDKAGS